MNDLIGDRVARDDDQSDSWLGRVLPELSAEITNLLRADGESTLAAKFESQPFLQWCGCGDDFCQSFYTQPPPDGPFGPGHRTVPLRQWRMASPDVTDL